MWTMRQNGAIMAPMNTAPKSAVARALERFNLRLAKETIEAIDRVRARRVGTVSRNTWITEAIEEKLIREGDKSTIQNGEHEAHE
ncbi:ribbon-helix-helix domain-containing protein [Paraburkholderia tropica]|uniref:hypothetical protein n=1 Tax=Paraburkholderia tropica TaxID=92647 RepID=UPI002AB6E8BD|nr:hypothetical protein [Paraburkholderia tropica]